jgi:PelA/Pel-15E family pectate lyase
MVARQLSNLRRQSLLARSAVYALLAAACTATAVADDHSRLPEKAADALRRATTFFTRDVSTRGGYLWRYSEDLQTREGEGRAGDTTVWVQPPGTPSVGMSFLDAYEATGEALYLDAARHAGECLVRGQLRSGGWDYRIEFASERRQRYAYRVDPVNDKQRNTSTLDDNTTQAALRFLMRLDQALAFRDAQIHEAAEYALQSLLDAQCPIGAWPQRFSSPHPEPDKLSVKRAGYPATWSRTFPGNDYKAFYTLNDNAMADTIAVMFEAARVYNQPRYREAAVRGGEFLLLAQMPEPQPAWAQQYNLDMQPAWARKFEPPAVTGGESQGVMRTLLMLYQQTQDRRFLEPIPRAIAYFRRSQLPGGRLARFYELQTNRPLYFTRQYELTYRDDDLPTHYAFTVGSSIEKIARQYERIAELDPAALKRETGSRPAGKPSKSLIDSVERVVGQLDDRGRWVEDGRMKYHGDDDLTMRIIDCRTFVRNVGVLSDYLRRLD